MDSRPDTAYRLVHRLRDIQVPDDVPAWPPAPGWWLLALGAVLLAGFLRHLWLRRSRTRRAALEDLARIQADHRVHGDTATLAAALSVLLRRVALARDGRRAVAGLTGAAWLGYLDSRLAGDPAFTDGTGRVLARLPYGGPGAVDPVALIALARRWIGENT